MEEKHLNISIAPMRSRGGSLVIHKFPDITIGKSKTDCGSAALTGLPLKEEHIILSVIR
jgi:hypothetical protein